MTTQGSGSTTAFLGMANIYGVQVDENGVPVLDENGRVINLANEAFIAAYGGPDPDRYTGVPDPTVQAFWLMSPKDRLDLVQNRVDAAGSPYVWTLTDSTGASAQLTYFENLDLFSPEKRQMVALETLSATDFVSLHVDFQKQIMQMPYYETLSKSFNLEPSYADIQAVNGDVDLAIENTKASIRDSIAQQLSIITDSQLTYKQKSTGVEDEFEQYKLLFTEHIEFIEEMQVNDPTRIVFDETMILRSITDVTERWLSFKAFYDIREVWTPENDTDHLIYDEDGNLKRNTVILPDRSSGAPKNADGLWTSGLAYNLDVYNGSNSNIDGEDWYPEQDAPFGGGDPFMISDGIITGGPGDALDEAGQTDIPSAYRHLFIQYDLDGLGSNSSLDLTEQGALEYRVDLDGGIKSKAFANDVIAAQTAIFANYKAKMEYVQALKTGQILEDAYTIFYRIMTYNNEMIKSNLEYKTKLLERYNDYFDLVSQMQRLISKLEQASNENNNTDRAFNFREREIPRSPDDPTVKPEDYTLSDDELYLLYMLTQDAPLHPVETLTELSRPRESDIIRIDEIVDNHFYPWRWPNLKADNIKIFSSKYTTYSTAFEKELSELQNVIQDLQQQSNKGNETVLNLINNQGDKLVAIARNMN